MPIQTVAAGPVNNWTQPNRRMRDDLQDAVDELQFADLFRIGRTIATAGQVRIDVQSQWTQGGQRVGVNIQAQVAGATIAAIRLADTLGAANGQVNQDAVVNAVAAALAASGANGTWQEITGTSP